MSLFSIPLAAETETVFAYRQFSITQSGLIRLAVFLLVMFVVSHVLKRVFKNYGERMSRANPIVAANFTAVAKSMHPLLFAFTAWVVVPHPVITHTGLDWASPFDIELGKWSGFFDRTSAVVVVLAIAAAAFHFVRVPVAWFKRFADRTPSKLDDMLAPVIDTGLKVFVVLGALVQLASTISGSTPTQILGALAVGGLAVGLAAQDTVKNFFGSTMLILDKPFTLGDAVDIGSHTGVVESLGLRSTRIRTPEGHLVTVPNGDLANRAIRNISERRFIFQKFAVTVTYDTSPDDLEKAVNLIKDILKDHEGMNPAFPPRVHLEQMADWSLNIQIIYWYHPADWWKFMKFHENLMIEILKRLAAARIGIAFPTQTVIQQPAAPAGQGPAAPAGPK